MKNFRTLPLLAVLCVFSAALCACSGNEPDRAIVRAHVERHAKLPFSFAVAGLDVDWVMSGEAKGQGRFKAALKTEEELFARTDIKAALAAAGLEGPDMAVLRHALRQAGALPEPMRSSLLEKAPRELPERRRFVSRIMKKGDEIRISGWVSVEKRAGNWEITEFEWKTEERLLDIIPESGRDAALIVGAKETEQYIRAADAAVADYAARVEKALAELASRQEQERKAEREKALALFKPGTMFTGTRESGGVTAKAGYWIMDAFEEASGSFSGRFFPEEAPDDAMDMHGVIPPATREVMSVSMSMGGGSAALTPKDGVLAGTVTAKGASSGLTLVAVSAEVFEKELAAARKRQADKREKAEVHGAALKAALAPGSGFQGTWTASRTGALGMAVTALSPDGLSCEGFLFDPVDRGMRKPFTAVVNYAPDADNALYVTVARGEGLPYSGELTDTQNTWLRDSGNYTMTLAFRDGGLRGTASSREQVALEPVAGFADLLAADATAEEARRQALARAVSKGSAWQGTFFCPSGKTAGEVGLLFTESSGTLFSGEMYDPAGLNVRKAFTGSYTTDKQAKTPITIHMQRTSGPETYNGMPEFQRRWLRTGMDYSIALTATPDRMWGATETRCDLTLAPAPDFAERERAFGEAGKQRERAVFEAIAPGGEYRGAWTGKDGSGELALRVETRGESGMVFTARLYDPAEPGVFWPYAGAVIRDEKGDLLYKLTPTATERRKGKSDQVRGSTQSILNDRRASYNEIFLRLSGKAFEGSIDNNTTVSLLRVGDLAKKEEGALPGTGASGAASGPIAGTDGAPVAPRQGMEAEQAEAAGTGLPATAVAEVQHPPLAAPANGKPVMAAHIAGQENGLVRLHIRVLAPGMALASVRIDNIGGQSSLWRSDGKGDESLDVIRNGVPVSGSGAGLDIAASDKEHALDVVLKDNGAFAGKATDFRVTVFFAGGGRAMYWLKAQ